MDWTAQNVTDLRAHIAARGKGDLVPDYTIGDVNVKRDPLGDLRDLLKDMKAEIAMSATCGGMILTQIGRAR